MAKNYWIISDTHFSHANIIKYCNRPFANLYEMDQKLEENWNATVNEQDHIYHLGDVYFGGKGRAEYVDQMLGRLKGHKRLLLGNHDDGKDPILQKHFQKIMMWRMFPEFGILMTHVPVHESALGILMRPKEFYNDVDFEEVPGVRQLHNIHGHIHQNKSPTKRHRNVCVEWTDYKPINIEALRVK